MKMQIPRRVRLLAAQLVLLLGVAEGVTVRGVVTGDVDHLPWRKGKKELGWCTVKVWQGPRLAALTRTQTGSGAFQVAGLDAGRGACKLTVSRPGFVEHGLDLQLGQDAVQTASIHLRPDPNTHRIVAPRTGAALSAVVGETFVIECLAPKDARQWRADLRSRAGYRPLKVEDAAFGERAVWNGTKPGWRLRVRVPEGVAPGMHSLGVCYTDARGEAQFTAQAAAVHVLGEWPARFRLMPYLDFHLNWVVNQPGEKGEVQRAFFQAASLINPLFVSLGDDIGFETDAAVAMFHHMAANYCDVPVYLAYGNHDAGIGTAGHEYYFGPRWQTRRLGPHIGLVISYDLYQAGYAMPAEQKRFVNGALAKLHADPQVKLIFLAGHTHSWKPRADFFTLPFTAAERLAFPGHTDGEKAVEAKGLFMHSLSVGSMHGWAGMHYTGRVMELEGFEKGAATVKARLLPQAALPAVDFHKSNDGSATTNAATIRLVGLKGEWTAPEKLYTGGYFCKPPKAFRGLPGIAGARVRFAMAKGRYACSAGRIVSQADSSQTTVVTVAVDATQPATTVAVRPSE